ncbi:MAG: chlorite dismutase family protein [Ferrimicrobium sp.]
MTKAERVTMAGGASPMVGEFDGSELRGTQVRSGLGVLHLFGDRGPGYRGEDAIEAIKNALEGGSQVVTVAIVGHKAELAVMVLDADFSRLRVVQRDLVEAGIVFKMSYLSITEVSEYASGMSDEKKRPRLYPVLPPSDKPAWCFYPMSKRRNPNQNWYSLTYEEREGLMYQHGASGRTFSGKVVQLITGSTGLDDWEWGVTLFASHPDDLKDVVYTMRYDEVSASYAEFGPFYVGIVATPEEVFSPTRR